MRGRLPKKGTYVGTGAALSVTEVEFEPVVILIYNETDADVMWIAINGLAAGKALQITNHDTAQISLLSANGVTFGSKGFTVGSSLSESGKTMRYVAF